MAKPFLFLILLFLSFSILGFYFWQGVFLPREPGSQIEKVFLIEKGQGSREIAFNLEKEGLIRSAPLFRIYTLFTGISGKLQAGQYLISPSMNIPQISEKFFKGEVIKEKITIIEGWNLKDIAFYFKEKGISQEKDFFELVGYPMIDYSKTGLPKPKDFSAEFDFLKDKPKNLGLEGYLFPDTYFIQDDPISTTGENVSLTKAERIVRKMLANFDKKLTSDLREEIYRQKKSIFEIVTMASMIEKEVRTLKDKKLVSGILWKRLKNDIPLQVDATITYITGKKTTKISIEEIKIDSPYNTYKYLGLPPGPISNPGLDSLISAIYPEETDYWYYLSTPEGETIFSKTLEEHNLAKEKYLK